MLRTAQALHQVFRCADLPQLCPDQVGHQVGGFPSAGVGSQDEGVTAFQADGGIEASGAGGVGGGSDAGHDTDGFGDGDDVGQRVVLQDTDRRLPLHPLVAEGGGAVLVDLGGQDAHTGLLVRRGPQQDGVIPTGLGSYLAHPISLRLGVGVYLRHGSLCLGNEVGDVRLFSHSSVPLLICVV